MTIKIEAIYQQRYLNLISAVIKQLHIPETINRLIPYDEQCLTTPGEVVHLLLLDILSGRQALVHVQEWAAEIDLEKLLSSDTKPHHFNDDAIGRQMDRLHDGNIHHVFSQLAVNAFQKEDIESLHVLHGDTTSKSVYGQYAKKSENEEDLLITEGYSRDRPGAKQFQYGSVVNEDGIPIYADVHDGNTSDKTWNPQILTKVQQQLESIEVDRFIYVADSAAMTQATLVEAQNVGAYLISRGPNGLKVVKHALRLAEEQPDAWSPPFIIAKAKNSAEYRVQEQAATYYGHDVRLIVVESSALDKKKRHTHEKKKDLEAVQLQTNQQTFDKQVFHCEADAKEALDKWKQKKKWHYHDVQPTVEARQTIKRKPGRPKKDAIPEETVTFHIQLVVTFNEQVYEETCRKASRFVLVATVPPEYREKTIDAEEILRLYKGQIQVEMNFSFLKDPYFVDEIYLKKPARVEVLGYIFLLALLVYKVFQRRIRQHVTEKNPLIGAGKRKLIHPTGQAIFQLFTYLQVIVFTLPDGTKQRQFSKPLTYEQQKVLTYLGLDETVFL